METLRRAHRLARLVLAWFALSVGLAVAGPVLKPQAIEVICSGAGGTKVMTSDDGGDAHAHDHMKDCRACVLTALPSVPVAFATPEPAADTPARVLPVSIAADAAIPYSARAPPAP
jgi:hypothetical protein